MHNSFSLLNEVRSGSASPTRLPKCSSEEPVINEALRAQVLDSMSEEMRDGEAIKSLLASSEEEP